MKWYQSWQVFALGSAVFASLTTILAKIGVSQINTDLATFIRTVVILCVSIGFVTFRNEWQSPDTISRTTFIFLVLSGIATGLSWLCFYHALKLGPASKVAPIDKLSVVFSIGLAAIFLGEALTPKVILGGVLITAGALCMI